MPTYRTGRVTEILAERPGLQRLQLRMETGEPARAYCLTQLTGEAAIDDDVVCNTTAVELGLGTGGWHVVHWNLSRRELNLRGPDHVMKLRYTSLQTDVGTSELLHPDLPEDLAGVPVVVCQVHSQVGVVAAAIGALRPGTRVAYVMTDGAALPIALSDLVAELTGRGLLHSTVTAGHAFGGDLEAVTVHSAMVLARHAPDSDAEIVVVGMGPGVVGTGTSLGTTAIEAAGALDAVRALRGRPILCVRASEADERSRHQGISHHTRTVARLTNAHPAVATVPPEARHLPGVDVHDLTPPDAAHLLARQGLRITTMGRDVEADPLFFTAAAAAGALAVHLLGQGSETGFDVS